MFDKIDPLDLRPFEIATIRPPTENGSLSFKLTRNCYWNRCAFCPVFKRDNRFSRRSIDEITRDIDRARLLDDYLYGQGIGFPLYTSADYQRLPDLAAAIDRMKWEAGLLDDDREEIPQAADSMDPRLRWFLPWFKSRQSILDCMNHLLTWRIGGAATCFFGDADSLIVPPELMSAVIDHLRRAFPTVQRITIYGRTKTAAVHRTAKELRQLALAGINRVHFGLESGCDEVLARVNKGVTAAEHIRGCRAVKEAGMSCSVYVMPGLGGKELSERHAADTAQVLSAIAPDYIRLRSLEIFPGTGLDVARRDGLFFEASELQVVQEIRTMIAMIDCPTMIISDSATNLLSIHGRLPDDRARMLHEIDGFLSLDKREQLEFSFKSRLQSFTEQYGGLSDDLIELTNPMRIGQRLSLKNVSDNDLAAVIGHVREKLMP